MTKESRPIRLANYETNVTVPSEDIIRPPENVSSGTGQPDRPAPSLQEIHPPLNEEMQPSNWSREPLSAVMEYIVQKHHAYCRRAIATIEPLLSEVSKQHREKHPEVKRITLLFAKFSAELLRHLVKEEDTLFPYIARMEEAVSRKEILPRPTYGTVANPVHMMMVEHEASNEDFKKIRQACNNYACPADATPNFRGLYAALQELEQDLKVHSELEDKVLFPRAVALEREARRRMAGGDLRLGMVAMYMPTIYKTISNMSR